MNELYSEADCYGLSSTSCPVTSLDACYQSASTSTISNCGNKRPNYLHLRYKCVPCELKNSFYKNHTFIKKTLYSVVTSTILPIYNICEKSLGDLTSFSGFVTSPNYPLYESVVNECMVKIAAPSTKIVKIWLVEVDILSASAGNM